LDKFVKIIKYIFALALVAVLVALFIRIYQSDYKALEDVNISDSFISAYEKDDNVRTHAVNDGFSENGSVFAYSLVYMKDAGYMQFTVRYNTRHIDEVRQTYPDFKNENIKYVLIDGEGNTYEANVLETKDKFNYCYFKLEFANIPDFGTDFKIKMVLEGLPDELSKKSVLVIHRADDTSIEYSFSKSEEGLLNK
jgi:hypothetical protein